MDRETRDVDRAGQEAALQAALLLDFAPVAVTVLRDEAAFEAFEAERPAEPLYYCAAVRRAIAGFTLKLAAPDMACDTSPKFLGFEPGRDDDEFVGSYANVGLYRDHDVTHRLLDGAAALEPLMGLGLAPLSQQPSGFNPAVVIVMTDPHGAMRLAQAAGFLGHRFSQQTIGMHGMCVESTAAPIVGGEVCISLLCSGARHAGDWPDRVLSVGIPGPLLDTIVGGLRLTADRFEPDHRKAKIALQSAEMPELKSGSAYFLK